MTSSGESFTVIEDFRRDTCTLPLVTCFIPSFSSFHSFWAEKRLAVKPVKSHFSRSCEEVGEVKIGGVDRDEKGGKVRKLKMSQIKGDPHPSKILG